MASNKLANAGQQVLDNSFSGQQPHQKSAFIAMRAKPPPTTFSSKAISFYNGREEDTTNNPILIQSAERHNFATHDQGLTTNRESMAESTDRKVEGAHNMPTGKNNLHTTSATLTNLIQSIKN